MNKRWALGSAAVFALVVAFLILTNAQVGLRENINRPIPFLTGFLLTLLVMLLMVIETPVDPMWLHPTRRWWNPMRYRFWRIYDPLTMVLFGFFFSIGTYLLAVYGNFSRRFRLDEDAFDWSRFVLFAASLLGVLVIPPLIHQAWMRTPSRSRRRVAIIVGGYCYGMVVIGYVFHEVSFGFGSSLIGIGTATIVGVWWWERRHGWEREVSS